MKVDIFERKVESYKKMNDRLGDTMEYIMVRLLMHLRAASGDHGVSCALKPYVLTLFSSSTQQQAGQAEAQIKEEFQRLREVLVKEETLRLEALAHEEEQKVGAIQKLIEHTKKDIVALKELIDSLKKEMGNEDLPLLQVGDSSCFTGGIHVFLRLLAFSSS